MRRITAVPVIAIGIALTVAASGVALATSTPKSVKACVTSKGDLGTPSTKGKCAKGYAKVAIATAGVKGATGARGPQGLRGETGGQGQQGDTGPAGPPGPGALGLHVDNNTGGVAAKFPDGLLVQTGCEAGAENYTDVTIAAYNGDGLAFTITGTATADNGGASYNVDGQPFISLTNGTTLLKAASNGSTYGITIQDTSAGNVALNLLVSQGSAATTFALVLNLSLAASTCANDGDITTAAA